MVQAGSDGSVGAPEAKDDIGGGAQVMELAVPNCSKGPRLNVGEEEPEASEESGTPEPTQQLADDQRAIQALAAAFSSKYQPKAYNNDITAILDSTSLEYYEPILVLLGAS